MMGSLFASATGLRAHSDGMGVISNNLANVNTVGFKQSMMLYQDLYSQTQTMSSNGITGLAQVGMGTAAAGTRTLFTTGGIETTNSATDLAINGTGFFGVQKNGVMHYTRAGNFHFNASGALLDASGWNVMGRALVNGAAAGQATPIQLDLSEAGMGRISGAGTSALTAYSQLGGVTDVNENAANPYFAMASAWDGTSEPPLAYYSYREPVTLYDSAGNQRTAYLYYDLADTDNGRSVVEYVLAIDPSEDGSGNAGTRAAGLLMAGTLTFSSAGELINMTAFSPPGSGDPSDLSGWSSAAASGGKPVFNVTFAGAQSQAVTLDLGLTMSGSVSNGFATAAQAAANPDALYQAASGVTRASNATNRYGETAASMWQAQDGYGEGYLRTVDISENGVISGVYSNGRTVDLYQISLYRFTSQDGLRNEGNNHYSATPESGAAQEGVPGTENFGALSSYSLETSNVDYSREFTQLIINQRGFQMNSKMITTSDAMLQKALEIKRT